jgi:hypothetical protein
MGLIGRVFLNEQASRIPGSPVVEAFKTVQVLASTSVESAEMRGLPNSGASASAAAADVSRDVPRDAHEPMQRDPVSTVAFGVLILGGLYFVLRVFGMRRG